MGKPILPLYNNVFITWNITLDNTVAYTTIVHAMRIDWYMKTNQGHHKHIQNTYYNKHVYILNKTGNPPIILSLL